MENKENKERRKKKCRITEGLIIILDFASSI